MIYRVPMFVGGSLDELLEDKGFPDASSSFSLYLSCYKTQIEIYPRGSILMSRLAYSNSLFGNFTRIIESQILRFPYIFRYASMNLYPVS